MAEHFGIVIVGNSAAGLQALRVLRKHDRARSILLIDREDRPAYSRVHTPYFIGGKTERENLFIVDEAFYRELGIATRFGRTATALDVERRLLTLDDGTGISFGQLLLAVGGEARPLAVEAGRVSVLRHLADADRLAQLFPVARAAAALGAGLVSLPLLSHAPAETEKHLIVGSNRIFSRLLDAESAQLLEERFVAAGLRLHKRDDIADLTAAGRLNLTLNSGTQLTVDLLIVGKGVKPNTELAARAGLATGDGIRVDDCCRAGHSHIYAAGDCAEGADFVTGEATVQGNWLTAVEQGEVAALNMLGRDCRYEGSLKNNISEIFGVELAVVGYCGDDAPAVRVFCDAASGRYRKLFLDERERVLGAVLIGDSNDAGVYYHLVKSRAPLPEASRLSGTNRYAGLVRGW
ncbi:MAG: FAD-dependent oxidoreductase [Trichloromonas sp.]|nr:FAD-dependent oxidoreductase [Trichloromonas sp.]